MAESTEKKTFLAIKRTDPEDEDVYSVDEVIDHLGHGWHQHKVLLLCGLVVAASSMQSFVMSFVGPNLQCNWFISDFQLAMISSADHMGTVVFSLPAGQLSDIYGRKACLLLATSLWGFASALSAFSPTPVWMFILRFVIGAGLSAYVQVYPYALEHMPYASRTMIVLLKLMWAIGGLVCSALAILVLEYLPYMWLLLIISIPSIFIVTFIFFSMSEAANFYELTGEHEKLIDVLRSIARANKTPLPCGYVVMSSNEDTNRGNMLELFRSPLRKWTAIFTVLHFASGILYFGLIYLAVVDLEEIISEGLSNDDTVHCLPCITLGTPEVIDVMLSSLGELIANPLTYYAVRVFGERNVLFSLTWPGAALITTLQFPGFYYTGRLVLVRMISAALVIISFTVSPLYFMPCNRGVAAGLFHVAFRIGAIVAPFLVQVLLRIDTNRTIWLFVAIAAVAGLAAMFLPPKDDLKPKTK